MLANRCHTGLRNTVMAALISIACGCQSMGIEQTQAPLSAPTGSELKNLTYVGVTRIPVTLTDGEWHGEPFNPGAASRPSAGLISDFSLTGDLNDDGTLETVVLLWSNSGGSGTFDHLAVVGRDSTGTPLNLATTALGDRVKIRAATIDDGLIVIDVVQVGPDDAACCPGQKFRRTFMLENHTLAEILSEEQGRQSVADLAGVEWILTRFNRDEPLPDGSEVTLRFAGQHISGTSACNRYSGSVIEGNTPGTLTVSGPMISTRMACPPPTDKIEQRYLETLQAIRQYSFIAGKLALTWRKNDQFGTMLFVPRMPSTPE